MLPLTPQFINDDQTASNFVFGRYILLKSASIVCHRTFIVRIFIDIYRTHNIQNNIGTHLSQEVVITSDKLMITSIVISIAVTFYLRLCFLFCVD